MTVQKYLLTLIVVSALFFVIVASWQKTSMPYTDMVLTIIMVNFVMSKVFSIKDTNKYQ